MEPTKKIYYEDPNLASIEALVLDVKGENETEIICDRTIAFPEGGGQESDKGVFIVHCNGNTLQVPITDVQKSYGRSLFLPDFPVIQVETPIVHHIPAEFAGNIKAGMRVTINIDVMRREKLTIAHTGTHISLMGIEALYPTIYKNIRGCHIREDGSRLDFFVEEKMTDQDLEKVRAFANELIQKDLPVFVFHHEQEPEAWYWKCRDAQYACGGTHLKSTGAVGNIQIAKKNLGKNMQRIIFSFPNAVIDTSKYHNLINNIQSL